MNAKNLTGLGIPYCSYVGKDNSPVQDACFCRVVGVGHLMSPQKICWMKYSSDLLSDGIEKFFQTGDFRCALVHPGELWHLKEVLSYRVTQNVTFRDKLQG